jgi:hypothetical protein
VPSIISLYLVGNFGNKVSIFSHSSLWLTWIDKNKKPILLSQRK